MNAIAQIEGVYELNIGHALIADAVFVGLEQAVIMMKEVMYTDLQSYQKISLLIYVSGNLCH
ncbi:pyridoxine 5'-phosphate synthase [Psychrobacter sp.]|uniref:pyridoxine 5'-phosphate synthase n=1 Tax=Psychrobacter sp. TaxID=56811 RepID=UPI0035638DE6